MTVSLLTARVSSLCSLLLCVCLRCQSTVPTVLWLFQGILRSHIIHVFSLVYSSVSTPTSWMEVQRPKKHKHRIKSTVFFSARMPWFLLVCLLLMSIYLCMYTDIWEFEPHQRLWKHILFFNHIFLYHFFRWVMFRWQAGIAFTSVACDLAADTTPTQVVEALDFSKLCFLIWKHKGTDD